MARGVLAGVVVAAALGVVGSAAGGQLPILRSAAVSHRHVVLELSIGDLRPVELAVAKRRATDPFGALLARNVRVRETIRLSPSASGTVLWMSPKALRPGIYFVQVTAVETGGLTDCPRFMRNCLDRWSSIRRVVVRHSS